MLFLVLCLCCEKTEEDKYPNMPFFEDVINKEFAIKKIEAQPYVFDCFKEYYFLFNNQSDDIFIYKKEQEFRLIKTIKNGRICSLDKDGTIYYAYDIENVVKAYEIPYPYDKVIEIEHLDLDDYFGKDNILKNYKSEFEVKNLEDSGSDFDLFINEKRAEYVANTFLNKLKCIKKVNLNDPFYFLEYSNGKKQVIKSLRYIENNGGLLKAANSFQFYGSPEIFPYCVNTHKHLKEVNHEENAKTCSLYENNDEFKLELIDSVTLDYYLDGSNHITIGVGSNNLYYYEFKYKNKTLKFKSSSSIELTNSTKYEFLILAKGNTYTLE